MINEPKVTVVDSIMGTGKTQWAIQYILEHQDEHILYISPFLDELERVSAATGGRLKMPKHINGGRKFDDLKELLRASNDIASSTALFMRFDNDIKQIIQENGYTLILDEVIEPLAVKQLKPNDLEILKSSNCISLEQENGIERVIWDPDKSNWSSEYDDIKILAENDSLFKMGNQVLMWRYPPIVFDLFSKTFVMTYDFQASIMRYYFEDCQIAYTMKSVVQDNGKYRLESYKRKNPVEYRDLIEVYDGKLNRKEWERKNALSKNWYQSARNKEHIEQLRKDIANYLRWDCMEARQPNTLWTTFNCVKNKLVCRGFSKSFLACNAKSSNAYSGTCNLVYALNLYVNPLVASYFSLKGKEIDGDRYSLSQLLQWIWRSRIRNLQPIQVFIPSGRMRELLLNWLDGSMD